MKNGRISKDHPIDQIIGSPSKGVRTRSKHASFCEHYSFVSCIEPTSIEEVLEDSLGDGHARRIEQLHPQ